MAAVAALPNDMTIFTNGVDAIYLRAHRFARPLPKVTDPTKAARDPKFRKYMNGLRDYLDAQGGYIVYFNNIPRAYMVPADQLAAEMKLELIQQLPDGAIYRRLPAVTTKPAP
ncbi:MAG: hypothetical protein QOE14_752, partial [Humisphaera sp.]|nr:hypothetical protein [Humisphaera sp.]